MMIVCPAILESEKKICRIPVASTVTINACCTGFLGYNLGYKVKPNPKEKKKKRDLFFDLIPGFNDVSFAPNRFSIAVSPSTTYDYRTNVSTPKTRALSMPYFWHFLLDIV